MTAERAAWRAEDEGVLSALHALDAELLGWGGEARVYALGPTEVLRVHHPGAVESILRDRAGLLAELAAAPGRTFAVADVLELGELDGRWWTRETRLRGQELRATLRDATGAGRARLVESYLHTAETVGAVRIDRDWLGELVGLHPVDGEPIRTATWPAWVRDRIDRSLVRGAEALLADDPDGRLRAAVDDREEFVAALPEPERIGLVHGDYFPGNVLVEGDRVTGVVDFGPFTLRGDPALDVVGAVTFLDAIDETTDADRRQAAAWYLERVEPAEADLRRRVLALLWTVAVADPRVLRLVRHILAGPEWPAAWDPPPRQ